MGDLPSDAGAAQAVLGERLRGVENAVNDMRREMATKEGQNNQAGLLTRLEKALAEERVARLAGDAGEAVEREKVAARLQIVEDRLEGRRYSSMIAIAISVLGAALALLSRFIGVGG